MIDGRVSGGTPGHPTNTRLGRASLVRRASATIYVCVGARQSRAWPKGGGSGRHRRPAFFVWGFGGEIRPLHLWYDQGVKSGIVVAAPGNAMDPRGLRAETGIRRTITGALVRLWVRGLMPICFNSAFGLTCHVLVAFLMPCPLRRPF